MKKIIYVLVIVSLVITLVSCSNKNVVTIYSSMEDFRNEKMKNDLSVKFPNIKINIEHYSTGNHAAKLRNEGLKTKADIFLGLETAHVKSLKENFESLTDIDFSKFSKEIIEEDENRYIPWDKNSGAIIINASVLTEKGLPEPKSYEDLLNPEYKNLISMPNPKTSGTGYQFLLQWINNLGEEEAFKYVQKLSENITQFTTSGSGPINSLVRGDIAIGLGMTFQAVYEINQGVPLKLIFDETGAAYNTTSSGVIKGRLEKDNVKIVYEYLFNDYIKVDKEEFMPENIFSYDFENKIPNYPEIKYAEMSRLYNIEYKLQLLEKWEY